MSTAEGIQAVSYSFVSTVPVVGGFFDAGQKIGEMLSGEATGMKLVADATNAMRLAIDLGAESMTRQRAEAAQLVQELGRMKIEMATIGVGSPFKDMIAASRRLAARLGEDRHRAPGKQTHAIAERLIYLKSPRRAADARHEKGGEDREPKEPDEWFSPRLLDGALTYAATKSGWRRTPNIKDSAAAIKATSSSEMDKELVRSDQRYADQMKGGFFPTRSAAKARQDR